MADGSQSEVSTTIISVFSPVSLGIHPRKLNCFYGHMNWNIFKTFIQTRNLEID